MSPRSGKTVSQPPTAVLKWIRRTFRETNRFVTEKLSNIPTTHEPWLDMSLIESLSRVPMPPPADTGGWSVYLDTHFLGGRAMFRNWEIADIGLLVHLRQHGRLVRTKVALLQSKRLYPDEIKALPDLRRRYEEGFFSLMLSDQEHRKLVAGRRFHFTSKSIYRAYGHDGDQEQRVAEYEKSRGVPVFYLLYNPHDVPWEATVPSSGRTPRKSPSVGCRVVPARVLAAALKGKSKGYSPRYRDLTKLPPPFDATSSLAGWRLEHFVADLVVTCREGYVVTQQNDAALLGVFFGRSGPISAAVSVTIDAPDDVELALPPVREPPATE